MKTTVFAVLALMATSAFAQVHVNGYTRQNGTYVAPHYRTAPNNTISDNYSTQGNVNPYTGRAGTVPNYGYDNSAAQRQLEASNEALQQQLRQQQLQLQLQQQAQQRQLQQQMQQNATYQPYQPYRAPCNPYLAACD
jgi:parvulin-like peptidyl-prolyl isomerase